MLLLLAIPARTAPDCREAIIAPWNRFAQAATDYRDHLLIGVMDMRLRRAMDKAWRELSECECWR